MMRVSEQVRAGVKGLEGLLRLPDIVIDQRDIDEMRPLASPELEDTLDGVVVLSRRSRTFLGSEPHRHVAL